MAGLSKERKEKLPEKEAIRRQALVEAVQELIKTNGLASVKARDVAAIAGVGLGSVYYGRDLDDLILEANAITLAELEKKLAKATTHDPAERLVEMADAYLRFAQQNTMSWKALFDHKLPAGKQLPEWYLGHQLQLFQHVDAALQDILPALPRARTAELARTIFSAVHGVVTLGLEEKLGIVPPKSLGNQVRILTTALIDGLKTSAG